MEFSSTFLDACAEVRATLPPNDVSEDADVWTDDRRIFLRDEVVRRAQRSSISLNFNHPLDEIDWHQRANGYVNPKFFNGLVQYRAMMLLKSRGILVNLFGVPIDTTNAP